MVSSSQVFQTYSVKWRKVVRGLVILALVINCIAIFGMAKHWSSFSHLFYTFAIIFAVWNLAFLTFVNGYYNWNHQIGLLHK